MTIHPERSFRQTTVTIAATYGAWLVTLALGAGIFYVWLGAAREAYIRLRLDMWSFATYHDTVAILLAIGWLALAVATEGWYRHGAGRGCLGRRFASLAAIEGALLLLGYALLRLV